MAVGDIVTPASAKRAMNKINEMQRKWGLSVTSKSLVSGNLLDDRDAADMYNWLVQAKNKSTWNGTVPTQLNTKPAELVRDVFDVAYNTAEQIRTYCKCNCNYCRCNCDHCSCNCNDCCQDGNDAKACLDQYKK